MASQHRPAKPADVTASEERQERKRGFESEACVPVVLQARCRRDAAACDAFNSVSSVSSMWLFFFVRVRELRAFVG
jgi:hypothetical protein